MKQFIKTFSYGLFGFSTGKIFTSLDIPFWLILFFLLSVLLIIKIESGAK